MHAELWQVTALEQRVNQLNTQLAETNGIVLALRDTLAALIADHPDQAGLQRAVAAVQRTFQHPVMAHNYQQELSRLLK